MSLTGRYHQESGNARVSVRAATSERHRGADLGGVGRCDRLAFQFADWASKERRAEIPEWAVRILADDTDGLDDQEKRLLAERVADFLADNDFGEEVTFRFVGDPANETFHFDGERTDFNGIVRKSLFLPDQRAREIAQRQTATNDWLVLEARYRDVVGTGRIKLLRPDGVSVVSDIDDTIRVTDIPAGRAVVLRNTFLRPFVAVPGMGERYRGYGRQVDFHYVSGGPWQLYRVLAPFLITESGFPAGTFHMKNVPTHPASPESWRAWRDLVADDATVNHKKDEIGALIRACPGRQFILIGDSGGEGPGDLCLDLPKFS